MIHIPCWHPSGNCQRTAICEGTCGLEPTTTPAPNALPEPDAWASPDEAGDVAMLFPTREEAASYCGDDEQPIPLHTAEKFLAAIEAAVVEARAVPRGRPLEWERDSYGQWTDAHHGFSILLEEGDDEPYSASWGEGDSAQFVSLEKAQAWCQQQLDDWVSRHVVLATPG